MWKDEKGKNEEEDRRVDRRMRSEKRKGIRIRRMRGMDERMMKIRRG